jgi:quinol-cytochrome oxidoreductase complex cytochrome b subunit
MRIVARVREWIDERFGWAELTAPLAEKTVPVHRYSVWYYLGGITLFLFLVQVATGILLMLYYRPTAAEAFESVQYIMTEVEFGWLVRSVHSWAANLMVLTAFAHMFSVLFLHAYRKPRELTWVSGMLLLFLVLAFGFSGYLLPWNELAFFATKVGTDMVGAVPLVGDWLKVFLRGGEEVTGATLTRFYALHVAVLPGLTTLLLLLHLLLVQRFGISVPPGLEAAAEKPPAARPAERPAPQMKFFPNFLLRELMAWYVALGVLGALAALAPWELGTKADPFAPAPAGIRPEWFFMFMFETLKILPSQIWIFTGEQVGVVAFGVAGLLWVLLPFFDRDPRGRSRRWIAGAGIFALVYMVVMTVYGYLWG